MDFTCGVVVKKECPEDTDCQMVAVEEPAVIIKEENEECGEDISVGTDGCCEVKVEEYEWDEQVSGLGSAVTHGPFPDVNMEYVPGEIPYTEGDVMSNPTSPGSRVKPYFCNFCDYRTHKTSALAQHVRTHTGEKPYSCHLCEFRSSTSGSLKRHVRRHTGEKPYPCNECDYRGTSASDLQVHMRTHDAGKSFNCSMCEYRGTTSWNLREHIKTHTGDKPYSCHLCDFKCSASGSLKRHVRRHTGEKPFSCDICNYRCSCSSDLKVHRLIHLNTENKPFACKICEWRGVTNGQLKIHTKSHCKPDFYECSICGLKTGRINNLRNHMRTHGKQTPTGEEPSESKVTGGKPYACKSCDYQAISSSELSVHMTKHVGEKPSICGNQEESAGMNKVVAIKPEEPSCKTPVKPEESCKPEEPSCEPPVEPEEPSCDSTTSKEERTCDAPMSTAELVSPLSVQTAIEGS